MILQIKGGRSVISRRVFNTSSMWLLAGSVGTGLAGCTGRNKPIRYRMAIEVDTPHGLKTGTSVMESVFNNGDRFENSAKAWTTGQAPYVDLGGGRCLFSTLSDPFEKAAMFQILLKVIRYPETRPPLADPGSSAVDQANATKPLGVVRRQDYPLLAAFESVDAPETVKEVDPEDLTASFGPGHTLRAINVQIVDRGEPLTEGFEERFTKIAKFDRPFRERRAGSLATDDIAGQLQNGYFVRRF